MADKQRLGELLLEAGIVDQKKLDEALALQADGRRRLGYLLLRMGSLNEEDLQKILAHQLDIPLIEIREYFDGKARKLLPRSICKRYAIFPLRLGEHNILDLAMVDPSDEEAIRITEQLTGKVVRINLARHSDIQTAISSHIPWTLNDFLTRENSRKLFILISIVALIVATASFIEFNKTQKKLQFGITRNTETGIETVNHDLVILFQKNGKIIFRGYGKHAKGAYNISFNNLFSFEKFIKKKKNDFSQQQWNWFQLVIEKYQDNH